MVDFSKLKERIAHNESSFDIALNILCERLQDSLPEGYQIDISIIKEDFAIEIFDPNFDKVDFDNIEGCTLQNIIEAISQHPFQEKP